MNDPDNKLITEIYQKILDYLIEWQDEELKNTMAFWVNNLSLMLRTNSVPQLILILKDRIIEIEKIPEGTVQ